MYLINLFYKQKFNLESVTSQTFLGFTGSSLESVDYFAGSNQAPTTYRKNFIKYH